MNRIKLTALLVTLLIALALPAQKTKSANIATSQQQSIQTIEKDWLNNLLLGNDISHLSQSYAAQITQLKVDKRKLTPIRDNNYQENFKTHYSKYVKDLTKLAKLDKKVAETKWENKVIYLKQSYQRAKQAQKQLLTHLEKQQQFLIENEIPEAKLQLTGNLIQQTQDKLSAQTHELLGNPSLNKFAQLSDWQEFISNQNTKHKSLAKTAKNRTIIRPRKILRNSSLPYAGRNYSAPALSYTPEIIPSYADENAQVGQAIDLNEDLVVQFTPAINQLATDLGNDYIKIINYVRQNIKLEYYAGAQKGADATLRSLAGNDIDQATLLIALLRRSNIPARFVSGVIRQPIEQVMASVGLSHPNQVLAAINKAGIAHEPIVEGGQVVALHRQYTWVSAYLPYANYRGSAADISNNTWIPLAPAIKKDSIASSDYLYQEANINSDTLVIDYLTTSNNQSPLLFWKNQVQTDLSTNHPSISYEELLDRQQFATEHYTLLPSSLPFEVIATTAESHQLADNQIQSLTIQMGENAEYLDVTILIPEIAGKRLTLSYAPATVDDLNIINQSHGLGVVEPYLVDLRPVIKINGRQVESTNGSLPMASFADLKLTFNSTAGTETYYRNTLIGNYLNLTITTQSDDFALDNQAANQFADETRAIRIMHNMAKLYNKQWKQAEKEIANVMDVALIKPIPALTIVSPEFNLVQSDGLITQLLFKGMSIDAVTNSVDAISRDNNTANQYDFYRISALHGSFLESNIVLTQAALKAISADQGIRKLADTHEVLHLNADNYQSLLATTNHSQEVKEQITAWIQAGNHAILTDTTDTIDTWTGSSWVIYNPETGHSGYFISGIYAGCVSTESPEDWINSELYAAVVNPYSEGSNNDPLSAKAIFKIESTNHQLGMVNQTLASPLAVIVTDEFRNPVNNAQVEFEIRLGTGKLISISDPNNSSEEKLVTTSDANGIASVDLRFLENINGGARVLLNEDDENLSVLGVTRISVSVKSNLGDIFAQGMFIAIAQPDIAFEIDVTALCPFDLTQSEECLEDAGSSGAKGHVYHYRVLDQFGNYVSNVPIEIDVEPELSGGQLPFYDNDLWGLGPFPYYSKGKIAMKEDDCHEFSIFPLGCAKESINTKSNYFWTTFIPFHPNINLNKGFYDFEIKLSNPDGIPNVHLEFLPEKNYTYEVRDSTVVIDNIVHAGATYWRHSSNYFGPYGKYEAGTIGSTISLPRKYLFTNNIKNETEYSHSGFFDNYGVFSDAVYQIDFHNLISGTLQFSDIFTIKADTLGVDFIEFKLADEPAFYFVDEVLEKCSTVGGNQTVIGLEGACDDVSNIVLFRQYPVIDYVFLATIAVNDISLLYSDGLSQTVKSPVAIQTEILPSSFRPENTVMNIYKNNVLFSSSKSEYPNGSNFQQIFDPGEERLNGVFEVEIVMNHGNPFEIRSQRAPINVFSDNIVDRVNCSNTDGAFTGSTCGGRIINGQIPSQLKLKTSIDLSDPLVCKDEGLEIFLNSDAALIVSLKNLSTGLDIILIDETYPVGENIIPVTAEQLGNGTFEVTITATSIANGNTEVIAGSLHSVFEIKDSLSIGHAVVKGVDLADGSMIYSKKDISLPAPGADLEFTRTYSNKNRYELGPMGYGWSHNYMSRVIVGDCGRIYVTGADGGTARFRVFNDEIIPLKGFHSTLVENPDGTYSFYSKNGTHYHYLKRQNRVWWMDYIEDTNGNRLTVQLERINGAPIIVSVKDSVGRLLIYNYETKTFNNTTGQILSSITGPEGTKINFTYNDIGQLITAKREGDSTDESYEYSTEVAGFNVNLLTKITDNSTGAIRGYNYEDKTIFLPVGTPVAESIKDKQIALITETDGGSTTFEYFPTTVDDDIIGFNDKVIINQNGTITDYTLNDYGAATNISAPNGNKSMVWEIADEILLMSETDENGRTKSFEYDDNANLTKETIGSISRSYTYKPPQTTAPFIKDRIATYNNWRDKITIFDYDGQGNKTKETLDGISIDYSYNTMGLVKTIKDGRGNTQILTYDSYGQLATQTDAVGNSITMTWDTRGRKLSEVNANGNITKFTYDTSDRIIGKSISSGPPPLIGTGIGTGDIVITSTWEYTYESGGLIKTETDPNEHDTQYSYDKMGRLLEINNADSKKFSYSYDFNGNKLTENDFNNNTTTFSYDIANRLETKTEPESKVTTYTYDDVGNVLTETTADRTATYTYDPKRYFLTSFNGSGAKTTRTVDGEGNILTEMDPNDNLTTFTYDDFNRVLTEEGELDSGRAITYDGNGNIETEIISNINGNQTRSFTYDGANRRKSSTDAQDAITTYIVDGNGNVLTENMPQGKVTTYQYNHLNLVTNKTQTGTPSGNWVYGYDDSGNLTSETLPNGNIITTVYDQLNRPTSKTDSLGAISSFDYDGNSNIAIETDGKSNTTTYSYNGLNQRESSFKPLSRGHNFSYTPFGEMLTDTGPNGTITYIVNILGQRTSASGPNSYNEIYAYDLNDNLVSFTDSRSNQTTYGINALNQTTSQTTGAFGKIFTYDTIGNKLTETDYRGIQSVFTYDKENRQKTFKRAGELQQTTVYNSAGLAQTQTDANGNTRVHRYNSQYYRTQTNLPETQVIKYTPDAFGDVILQNNPGFNDITRVFDKRRRLQSETNGAGEQTQYEYDLNNNRTAVIKPDNTRWEYSYDAANRLTSIINTAENIETIYGYDNKDNLTSIRDAENKTTTFDYDNRNRKLFKHYPDSETVGYTYDANGNLKTVDLANGTDIVYGYDVLNRKTSEGYTSPYGNASITFTLDANGNPETITENIDGTNFTTTQSFDDLDRMTSREDVYGNNYNYTYDDNGNRKTFKDHNNSLTNYTYDDLNRLESLTHAGLGTFNWGYNSAGLVDDINYPNGASVEYQYDNANRIDEITNKKSGADITKHEYQYDDNGNRTRLTENNIHFDQIIDYSYDKADRLTTVEYPNNEKTQYVLDKVGNRDQEIITGAAPNTKTYSYNNRDQLTGITDDLGSNISYTFDDAGNQLTKDDNGVTTTFDYTARHRVKSITVGAGNPINYQYDFTGQRVNYQSGGIEKRYLYDGLTLIAQTNTIGNTIARYHYGDRYQLAETRNSVNSYYHVDSLGTNVAVTNQDGSVQARYEYDAYGNLLTQAGSSETPFGFTGYQKDEDTGLYYANARYYDSNTGRFLREDPLQGSVQTPPSLHRYMYAFANPGSYVDPTGNGNDTAHYYDALLIGQLVGLNESQSFAFALGAQIGDEFTQFDAVHNSAGYVAIKGFVQSSNQSKAVESIVNSSLQSKIINNCGSHALCGTKPSFLRNAASNFVLNDAQNFLEVGTADHSFTDSFFHIAKGELSDPENQKLLKPIIGHFWEKTNTDKAFRYHESKRVEAFEARAWLLYDFSVKQGTQKISKKQFKDDLNKAVTALGRQHDNLLRNNQKWGYADGGVYTLFTDYDDISDEEEFDMVRDMLSGKGLSKIPRTENHSPARNVNGLLNDFSKEQLIGIALEINKNIDRSQIENISKTELVKYVNGKLFLSQAKSRDAIYAGVMREKAKEERVQESEEGPGVKELSK